MMPWKNLVKIILPALLLSAGCADTHRRPLNINQDRASTQDIQPRRNKIERPQLLKRALRGCDWLADISQIKDKTDRYYGAMKGEYDTKSRRWGMYGPFWHTAQAVRTLILAYKISGDEKYLSSAVLGGEYLVRDQITDANNSRQYGFILSKDRQVSTASQIEGLMALYDLYKTTKNPMWRDRFHMAVDWIAKNLYLKGEGLFYNYYLVPEDKPAPIEESRPHLDDAVFAAAYQEFKDPLYLAIFKEIAERLLKDEDPPGNWIKYQPAMADAFEGQGRLHPRHAWWWGYPMLTAYDVFGEKKYMDAAIRAAQWYIDNNNIDGGYYYNVTKTTGKHLSFDFCTSGVGCAVIMWTDLWKRTGDEKYRKEIEVSLGFLLRAQFNEDLKDQNVRNAFWESYLPPDGSLQPGFYVRDIATIFAARAMLEIAQAFDDSIYYAEY